MVLCIKKSRHTKEHMTGAKKQNVGKCRFWKKLVPNEFVKLLSKAMGHLADSWRILVSDVCLNDTCQNNFLMKQLMVLVNN